MENNRGLVVIKSPSVDYDEMKSEDLVRIFRCEELPIVPAVVVKNYGLFNWGKDVADRKSLFARRTRTVGYKYDQILCDGC